MRTYRIYLIRHGATQGNLEGKYIGSTDLPLCDQGIDELWNLSQAFDYPEVGKVYTSPLIRCIQTSKLIYPHHTPVIVDGIKEYDFGEFENKSIAELMNDEKYNKWIESDLKDGLEGGENITDFNERVLGGLDSIIMDMMKNKISDAAVVTHGGVIMHMLCSCGLPRRKPTEWMVENGKGYTLLVNASLWGNNKAVEVFTAVPYSKEIEIPAEEEHIDEDYMDEDFIDD